jgi:hypothetical protein
MNMIEIDENLPEEDLTELEWAHRHLEHPSLAARLSSVIGVPMEQALRLLPQSWYRRIDEAAERSIKSMLDLTIKSMAQIDPDPADDRLHRLLVAGTGAVGGFFGPLMLLAELPVTTALMLRSIADIAHSQGEDMASEETRVACMQVFALGGRTKEDSAADTGYYGLRLTLSLHFSQRLFQYRAVSNAPVPAGLNLARGIASRFGVVVSDKVAAQMVPVAGAVGGALVNLVFMHHFQDIARGHFIVRRLERRHGVDKIRIAYEKISEREAESIRSFSPLEGW